MKSRYLQFIMCVWCYISGEAAGEIWNWSLSGVKGLIYRAVYTRENKPRITQSAAFVSRELSHLYGHDLHKQLVRGLRKPRTSFLCRLYEQFAAYISRGLCNLRLIFPRINGPYTIMRYRKGKSVLTLTLVRNPYVCVHFFFLGKYATRKPPVLQLTSVVSDYIRPFLVVTDIPGQCWQLYDIAADNTSQYTMLSTSQ